MNLFPAQQANARICRCICLPLFLLFLNFYFPAVKCFSQACVQGSAAGPQTYLSQSNFSITNLRINTPSGACLTLSNCHHVAISNCIFGPSPSGLGIDLENCSDILITNCAFINNIGGVYANNSSTIKVNNNQFSNIAANHGSRGQFVQFNQVTGAGNEIKDNVGENAYGIGDPGDLINIYNSFGTSTSPIVISGNKLRNGSNNNTTGGILVGDQGGSYITVQNNTLVNSGHFGIGVAGGSYIKVLNNNIYIRPLDIPGYYANVSGVYVWGQGPGPCSNIDLEGNAV